MVPLPDGVLASQQEYIDFYLFKRFLELLHCPLADISLRISWALPIGEHAVKST